MDQGNQFVDNDNYPPKCIIIGCDYPVTFDLESSAIKWQTAEL